MPRSAKVCGRWWTRSSSSNRRSGTPPSRSPIRKCRSRSSKRCRTCVSSSARRPSFRHSCAPRSSRRKKNGAAGWPTSSAARSCSSDSSTSCARRGSCGRFPPPTRRCGSSGRRTAPSSRSGRPRSHFGKSPPPRRAVPPPSRAPFDTLARRYGDPEEGKVVPELPLSQLPPDYERAIGSDTVPGLKPVFAAGADSRRPKFVVFELLKRLPEGELTFDDVKDRIRENMGQQLAVQHYLEVLRRTTYVDVRP